MKSWGLVTLELFGTARSSLAAGDREAEGWILADAGYV